MGKHSYNYTNYKLSILKYFKSISRLANTPIQRPQLADVKAQLKANDVVNLKKQKVLLESLAKEYEAKVNRMKKILLAKRGYLKALQLDIQKYQKKNEDFVCKISDKLENHNNLISTTLANKTDVEEICWKEKDMDVNEII